MPTHQETQILRSLYLSVQDRPLRPDIPEDIELYEPIFKPTPDHDEPIDVLASHIDFNPTESIQLFSGFRGSGKTTELLRLQHRLERQGCLVVYANALDYINPSAPIDISDLLITIAGAFSDTLLDRAVLGDNFAESYWDRLLNFFKRIRLEVSDVGVKVGGDIKLTLRTTPTFRERVQEQIAKHIGSLKKEIDDFSSKAVMKVWEYHGEGKKIVFILDSLEQLRGSLPTEKSVMASVQSLFSNHFDKLKLPHIHAIYTVPPWLRFVVPGTCYVRILPTVRLWNNDASRSPFPAGVASLSSLVRRRLRDEGITQLFGGDPTLLRRLIDTSGGHLRDVILLLQETMLRARDLPIGPETVERAVASVRGQYLPIAVEDARWLQRISRLRSTDLQSADGIGRLMHFLDSHMVLYLINGTEWYDIHPLIRQEVEQLAARPKDMEKS